MMWVLGVVALVILGLVLWAVLANREITIAVERTIEAPAETVFKAVSDIESFPEIQPDVISVEFLTESRSGVGTRFRETRRQGKKAMLTELEVAEYIDNERVGMVTDSHGTVWDTVFVVRPVGSKVELTITMDARPHAPLARVMTPFLAGMFGKGMESYGDLVREYCEKAGKPE